MKKIIMLLVISSVFASLVPMAEADAVLKNDDIINMVELGLDEELILTKIEVSDTEFDTSTEALLKLKEAKVSTTVIKKMMNPNENSLLPGIPGISPACTTFFYLSPTGKQKLPGIRAIRKASRRKAFIPYYPANASEQFYFLKGSSSNLSVSEKQPVFITEIAPASLQLIKFGMHRNGDRYIVFEQGSSDREIQIEIESSKNGSYKIKPTVELQPGEYAFMLMETHRGAEATAYEFTLDLEQTREKVEKGK